MSEEKNENSFVETYAGDMAEVISNDQGGLVKKIIHSAEEKEEENKKLSPESKKNRTFLILGVLLIILAISLLSFFIFRPTNNTVSVTEPFTPIIFTDQSTLLEVAKQAPDEVAQAVYDEINNKKVKIGGIEAIYPTENNKIVGLRRFLAIIKSSFTPVNNPLFVSDNFLMGVVNVPQDNTAVIDKGFFMLIKVRTNSDIFDSLRAWEANMFSDLHGFIVVDINGDTNYLVKKSFDNGIVENKNARILYDKDGKIVLMYVFADDNSIVITDSDAAAHEVMQRLASSR